MTTQKGKHTVKMHKNHTTVASNRKRCNCPSDQQAEGKHHEQRPAGTSQSCEPWAFLLPSVLSLSAPPSLTLEYH
jgi:hypothetical protein